MKGEGVLHDVLTSYRSNFLNFQDAPVVLVCCFVKPSRFATQAFPIGEENRHLTGELISMAMCVQNILLLAEAAGLGAVIMTAPLISAPAIRSILKIPPKYHLGAFVCMGNYDAKPPMPRHKSLEEVLRIVD